MLHPLHTPFGTGRFRYAGLISMLLLLWSASPGRASLVIEASTPQSERWRAAYGQISTAWKTRRLLRVREATKREMEQLIADSSGEGDNRDGDGDIDGCFSERRSSRRGRPGHHHPARQSERRRIRSGVPARVRPLRLGQRTERARAAGLDPGSGANSGRSHHLVTPYAEDSDEEGFAEAFAYFVHKPEILRRKDARAFHFLQEAQAS